MPINFPDFSAPRKSALQRYLEGYAGFNAPMNMMQEQEQQRLGNEQMRLANIFDQAKEPYAEEYARNKADIGRAQIENMNIGELGKMIRDVDNTVRQYGFDSPQAELARQWLENKVRGRDMPDHRTHEQKLADDLSDGDPELRRQILKQMSDVYLPGEEEKLAVERLKQDIPGAIPMSTMGKGQRNEAFKKMQKEQERGNKVRDAKKIVDAMRDLQEKYPKLSEAFSNTIKVEDPTKWGALYRKLPGWLGGLNKDELTAVQQFRKLASTLVLDQASIMQGKTTDALRQFISQSKPSSTNTYEANQFLFDKLDEEYIPLIMYADDVDRALDLNTYIPQNLSKYKHRFESDKNEKPGKTEESDPLELFK